MSETRAAKIEREKAKAELREWIKPGDTVHTILRHVSRSGMLREIGIVLLKDGSNLHPNYLVAEALGERIGKRDGVIVGGCGMDMGFHIVYNLGYALWPDGFGCIGKGCRSNDHFNGDRDYTPHPKGGREITYHDRTNPQDEGCAVGDWEPELAPTGASVFRIDSGHALYLFPGEVDSDEPAGRHWHRDGGYALNHLWL